jgi:8-oxoguanine deaminase
MLRPTRNRELSVPTKVTARYVLGHQNGSHVLLEDACVVYSGRTIEYVGHDYTGPVDQERHLGDALLMPGLIDLDALTDIDHLILDSWAGPEQAKGYQWSEDYFRNHRARTSSPPKNASRSANTR